MTPTKTTAAKPAKGAAGKKKGPAAAPAPVAPPTMAKFRNQLYRLRTEKGLSMSDLARMIWGTTTDNRGYEVPKNKDRISRWESGAQIPEPANLALLSKALDVSLEELAPDLVSKKMDRDDEPAISFTMVQGRPDMARLVVNTFCTMTVAAKVIQMLSADPYTAAVLASVGQN